MRFLIEIILLVVILLCAWNGHKKGLVMCIGSILAIIISLYVGDLLSDTFSPSVSPVVRPFVSGYMSGTEGVINDNLNELIGADTAGLSLEDAIKQNPDIKYQLCVNSFEKVGIYSSTAKIMATKAVKIADENASSLSTAIVDVMCDSFTYYLGFILFFAVSLIILTVLGNILNLSFKIPEMDKLNDVGGAVAGAVTGIMFCIIIAWALKLFGAFLPEENMKHTLLTALFLKMNILSHFLTI